jgi:hypothetical protein
MYKLLNLLFGWDYIHWSNSAASGIARVIALPSGEIAYWRYRNISVMDVIEKPTQVRWLTCPPTKYFPTENK